MTAQTDRELLEMAAKAAGYTIADWVETRAGVRPNLHDMHAPGRWTWDPITDDGDCARLESTLEIELIWRDAYVFSESRKYCGAHEYVHYRDHGGDKNVARRRASTLCAANLGKAMRKMESALSDERADAKRTNKLLTEALTSAEVERDAPMALHDAHRELHKWLNEQQEKPIDRQALATVLWAVAQQIGDRHSTVNLAIAAMQESLTLRTELARRTVERDMVISMTASTAPQAQPAADLTDMEIHELWWAAGEGNPGRLHLPFARSVIASQKAKNETP